METERKMKSINKLTMMSKPTPTNAMRNVRIKFKTKSDDSFFLLSL